MVTRDNDRAAAPSDTARAQLLRRTLFTNTIGAQSLLLPAAYAAKEARPGPLPKAIAAPEGVELTGSVRSRVEVIGGQSHTARATSDLLWSARAPRCPPHICVAPFASAVKLSMRGALAEKRTLRRAAAKSMRSNSRQRWRQSTWGTAPSGRQRRTLWVSSDRARFLGGALRGSRQLGNSP